MKEAFINKLKDEYGIFRSEIKLPEYILWWVARIVMIHASIEVLGGEDTGHHVLQMVSNTIMLFILPTLHIFPRKWAFLARLSYHNQTVAVIMMMLATYLGNHRGLYDVIPAYDFWVHLFSGIILVFVGFDLAKALAPKSADKFDTNISTIVGFGLSCFGALFWEIYEFTFDCLMGSATQALTSAPEEILLKIFTASAEQTPLFDTMTDLVAGFVGAVIGGLFFRILLTLKDKKAA